MYIATWNLNNRAGRHKFRPEAADAAMALGADILVFTEFFPNPKEDEGPFRAKLKSAGWSEQLSTQPSEVANRVLIASTLPLAPMTLDLPTFDQQFPANLLGVTFPSVGLSVLGVRVPAYADRTAHYLTPAWDWLEATTASLRSSRAVVIGDLNVQTSSRASRAGDHFRRILANGWRRAVPGGATFFGHKGKNSEIDHALATHRCILSDAACVQKKRGFRYSGSASAISDHAALTCRVESF